MSRHVKVIDKECVAKTILSKKCIINICSKLNLTKLEFHDTRIFILFQTVTVPLSCLLYKTTVRLRTLQSCLIDVNLIGLYATGSYTKREVGYTYTYRLVYLILCTGFVVFFITRYADMQVHAESYGTHYLSIWIRIYKSFIRIVREA